jgi:PIN domain nuclease of toxin-antitoxin system
MRLDVNPECAVLDASALLAYFLKEPGHDRVGEAIGRGAVMSTVNLSEVVAKLTQYKVPNPVLSALVERSGIDVVPFNEDQALRAGLMHMITRSHGISLGGRACLALAEERRCPGLTADRGMAKAGSDMLPPPTLTP